MGVETPRDRGLQNPRGGGFCRFIFASFFFLKSLCRPRHPRLSVSSAHAVERTRLEHVPAERKVARAAYAALRSPARKVSTLLNSAVACWLRSPDATRTLSARARDWSAAPLAPPTLPETSPLPPPTSCPPRAISPVA